MAMSINTYERHMTIRRPKEVMLKKYKAKIFDGSARRERILYANNYEAAVRKLGVMPPSYVWTVEEV